MANREPPGEPSVPVPARWFDLPVQTHGHYVVDGLDSREPLPLLVGFHGYGETAEQHLEALRRIPGSACWRRCAVQGLHLFYSSKTVEVRASWMTRFGRELAIADNVRYVASVVTRLKRDFPTREPLVYAGFSQGVAMAYRAALGAGHPCRAMLALGGDLPPDVGDRATSAFPRVLIGRGTGDTWYTEEKLAEDEARLRNRGVELEVFRFEGGHEWHDAFAERAGGLLAALLEAGR
jgi:predicted esterase